MAASASDWVGISTKPIDTGDLAETDKQVLEFVLGDCERQIAYIDVHDILVCVLDRAQNDRAEVHKLPYSHRRRHSPAPSPAERTR